MDLMTELRQLSVELDESIRRLRKNGIEAAERERDYKIHLRQECLKLRDEGMPVGLIDKVCYGIPSVANKRFDRDVAQATYKANQEHINVKKLQLRIVESQINREWNNVGTA